MTFKKIPGAKSEFGELSIDGLQESFKDDEKSATEYLDYKFGIVSEQIKEAVRMQLITDGEDVFYSGLSFN